MPQAPKPRDLIGGATGSTGGVEELEDWVRRVSPSRELLTEQLRKWAPGGLGPRDAKHLLPHMERLYHLVRVFRALAEAAGDRLVFGGGSVLNYIYMPRYGEPPRLTLDIDSSPAVEGYSVKRGLLGLVFDVNRWVSGRGEGIVVGVGGRGVPLGYLVRDTEADTSPGLLALKVSVVTVYGSGEPLYRYASKVLGAGPGYRAAAGAELARRLRVVEVGVKISLEPVGEAAAEDMELPFSLGRVTASTTDPHLQVAMKVVSRLGREWGDRDIHAASHGMLKAVLDARLAGHLGASRIRAYVETLGGAPWGAVLRNTSRAWAYMVEHYSGFHYALARLRYPSLEELWRQVRAALERVLGEQP